MEYRKYCVYVHTNKLNGQKYVGQTSYVKPEYRWNNGKGYKVNEHFARAIEKYGWNNFEHEIVCENLTHEEANKIECELINKYNTLNEKFGYNKKEGGSYGAHTEETKKKISLASKNLWLNHDHRKLMSEKLHKAKLGHTITEETRQKLINSHKGQVAWNKGKHHSQEEIEKMKLAWVKKKENGYVAYNKGKHLSEEQKEKLRQANLGKKHSEETKIKISNSNKGKKKKQFTEEHKRKIGLATKGRICLELTKEKQRNAITGRKFIHKDGVLKLVAKTEVDDYLTNGWILGMVI